MFKQVFMIIVMLSVLFCGSAMAESKYVTLPDGNKIDVSKLSESEIYELVKISSKAVKKPEVNEVMSAVQGMNPDNLNSWRKLITGTIKDVCNDLNVTVNEFVKTPVGLGVSALIIYKVAGKEILSEAMDIVLCIPFWFVFTFINAFLIFYFYGSKTVYEEATYGIGEQKRVIKTPKRVDRYAWEHKSEGKQALGWYIVISEIVVTIIVLCFVLG